MFVDFKDNCKLKRLFFFSFYFFRKDPAKVTEDLGLTDLGSNPSASTLQS